MSFTVFFSGKEIFFLNFSIEISVKRNWIAFDFVKILTASVEPYCLWYTKMTRNNFLLDVDIFPVIFESKPP